MSIVPPTGIIRKYYEEAVEDIEYRSSAFWQIWLQREFAQSPDELETYGVTSKSSPDGTRRRVDQVVKRYERNHHYLSSLVWNECKRPTGNPKEAEKQALDAAVRCIRKENLLFIYALTTVGVTFHVWRVDKDDLQLVSMHPSEARMYVDADSQYGWILRGAVASMKEYIPLGDAPIVPSHSRSGVFGQSSMQEEEMPPAPAESYGQQLPPTMPLEDYGQHTLPSITSTEGYGRRELPPEIPTGDSEQYERENMQERYYGDEAEASGAVPNTNFQDVQTWSKVVVRRKGHFTSRDEYVFTSDKGHEKSTDRDDWRPTTYKGKQAWYFRYKGTYYYTREKPGG